MTFNIAKHLYYFGPLWLSAWIWDVRIRHVFMLLQALEPWTRRFMSKCWVSASRSYCRNRTLLSDSRANIENKHAVHIFAHIQIYTTLHVYRWSWKWTFELQTTEKYARVKTNFLSILSGCKLKDIFACKLRAVRNIVPELLQPVTARANKLFPSTSIMSANCRK